MRPPTGWRICLIGHGSVPGRCGGVVAALRRRDRPMMAVLKTGAALCRSIRPTGRSNGSEFVLADANPAGGDHLRRPAFAGGRTRGPVVSTSPIRPAAAQPVTAARARRQRLCHLHLGTTGKPKGVAIAHYTVTWLMESRTGGPPPGRVWTQCHSLAFDFSVWEIFGAAARSPAGGGARGGGRLRRRTCTPCWSLSRSASRPRPLSWRPCSPGRPGVDDVVVAGEAPSGRTGGGSVARVG